jgi:hypothetical protein
MADFRTHPQDPAPDGFAITPANTDLASPVRCIYVGGAGDVVLRTIAGTVLTFVGVPAGSFMPVQADRVLPASTATNIVGLV